MIFEEGPWAALRDSQKYFLFQGSGIHNHPIIPMTGGNTSRFFNLPAATSLDAPRAFVTPLMLFELQAITYHPRLRDL